MVCLDERKAGVCLQRGKIRSVARTCQHRSRLCLVRSGTSLHGFVHHEKSGGGVSDHLGGREGLHCGNAFTRRKTPGFLGRKDRVRNPIRLRGTRFSFRHDAKRCFSRFLSSCQGDAIRHDLRAKREWREPRQGRAYFKRGHASRLGMPDRYDTKTGRPVRFFDRENRT